MINLRDDTALDIWASVNSINYPERLSCWSQAIGQSLFLSPKHRRNDKIISVGTVFILLILKILKGIMVFVCAFKDSLFRHYRCRAVYIFLFVEA